MRLLKRLPIMAAATAVGTLIAAVPAFAAGKGVVPLTPDCLPEVPYAALLPVVAVGAILLMRRRTHRTE